MELTLFMFLFALSFGVVFLGFWRSEHSEFSLIGFVFIFLLSLNLISGSLEYQTGELTTTNYTYSNDTTLLSEIANNEYQYTNYKNKTLGYWLAVGSFFSFVIIIYSLGRTKRGMTE